MQVFVDLWDKTREIREKAEREQALLEAALKAQAETIEAQAALRASQQRQEAILRALPVVFHSRTIEPPHAMLFVSDGVEGLTGFPPARHLEDPAFGLSRIHPEDRSALLQAHREAEAIALVCRRRSFSVSASFSVLINAAFFSRK